MQSDFFCISWERNKNDGETMRMLEQVDEPEHANANSSLHWIMGSSLLSPSRSYKLDKLWIV